MKINRRDFTRLTMAAALAGFSRFQLSAAPDGNASVKGYGALIPDADGILDLPAGFSYRILSSFGDTMSDGLQVPSAGDGMGCIPMEDGRLALIRNHELKVSHAAAGPYGKANPDVPRSYDTTPDGMPLPGGTTTLIYNPATGEVDKQFLSLVGTIRNCAGGITPWGSWLTCEEDVTIAGKGVTKDHGWVFEVPATAEGLVDPVPLKALGRFNHEAAAVDPRTGIVYLTEDRNDSLFYRLIPNTPGKLTDGGKLQAMAFRDSSLKADSRNWGSVTWHTGDWRDVVWIDLEDTDAPKDDLRNRGHKDGGVLFARGEGIHWGDGELYFCCTSGGNAKLGQIIRYKPSAEEGTAGEKEAPGTAQMFLESADPEKFNFGDNLTVAPNGHLFVCEDQYSDTVNNYIRAVTPDGRLYPFARIRLQTEPAGACFSPDGTTMFVNMYHPTKTLAITGPWDQVSGDSV